MHVVSARMHRWLLDTICICYGDIAGVRRASALEDRERVDVCAQEDGGAGAVGESGGEVVAANGGVNSKC